MNLLNQRITCLLMTILLVIATMNRSFYSLLMNTKIEQERLRGMSHPAPPATPELGAIPVVGLSVEPKSPPVIKTNDKKKKQALQFTDAATLAANDSPAVVSSDSSHVVASQGKTEPSGTKKREQTIMMATYVFGEQAANQKYLQIFVESARYSGIDVAIVGDPKPPFDLPPNIKHVPITWKELVDRVYEHVFDGDEPGNLRNATPYKIVDMKPLLAFLFPEVVDGYDFWGHLDNDLVLGNITRFVTQEVLESYDIICPIEDWKAWGPFMLYRNTKQVNELWRLSQRPLEEVLAVDYATSFSEWGHRPEKSRGSYYNSSMAGIIDNHADDLGLRWRAGNGLGRLVWDGEEDPRCIESPEQCADCFFDQGELIEKWRGESEEVLLCHYQFGKPFLEKSLKDKGKLERLSRSGKFRVSYPQGFADYVNPKTIKENTITRETDKFKKNLSSTVTEKEEEMEEALIDTSACFLPNTAGTEELAALNETLPRPILNVGMPKCGSTSLKAFFNCAGLQASHWGINGSIGICMKKAAEEGRPIISSCDFYTKWGTNKTFDHGANALMQMDVENNPRECIFPQMSYLDQIHEEHPNATFILNFRPVSEWIQSITNWYGMAKRLTKCDLPGLPVNVGSDPNDLRRWLCGHVTNMRNFVKKYPSHRLIELDLYNVDQSAKVLARLFQTSEACWGKHNVNTPGVAARGRRRLTERVDLYSFWF